MKRLAFWTMILFFAAFSPLFSLQAGTAPVLDHFPLRFEENRGQADAAARYVARGSGGVLLFCDHEIAIAVPDGSYVNESGASLSIVRLSFPGSNPQSRPVAEELAPGIASYFKGQDSKDWKTGIPTYRRVVWSELYPGVDLVCYGVGNRLEYDFVVQPGADPGVIRLAFDGVDTVHVDEEGHLRLDTGSGEVVHQSPIVSQETEMIAGEFRVTGDREVAFSLGEYDSSQALVIDPVMLFCSYLGGNGYDQCTGIGELPDGTVIVVGQTSSSDFVLKDSGKVYDSSYDAFITGITPSGDELVFSTRFGGTGGEGASTFAVGADGTLYVGGSTSSSDLPTVNPVQATYAGGTDVFITQLGPRGTNILFSTYYGGTGQDRLADLAVKDDSSLCFAGGTYSVNFPLVSAVKATHGIADYINDGFAVCLDTSHTVVFSTYLGGTGGENAEGVAFGPNGSVYICGTTWSTDFQPMGGGLQSAYGGGARDAFVTKLTSAGALAWSTYLGKAGTEMGYDVVADTNGNAIVAGYTQSANFPLVNAIRSTYAGQEGFLSKIRSDGSGLIYSTFVGGGGGDTCSRVTLDEIGNAYVGGETSSTDFPAVNAWGRVVGGDMDAFVAAVDPAGNDWLFSGQFGGSSIDSVKMVSLAANGDLLVAGQTQSTDLSVLNAFQETTGGGFDEGFFARLTTGAAAFVPFVDGFEWGRFNGFWSPSGTTRLQTDLVPHSGTYHMAFGIAAYQLDEATLSLNLAGRTSTSLRFWYKHVLSPNGRRYGTVLPDTFNGSVNGNGVAISGDGTNWVKIAGLSDSEGIPASYTEYEIELDPVMAAHGISNAGVIFIKFVGYGTNPPGDRHVVDDITILSRSVQFETGNYSTPEGQAITLTVVRSGSTDAIESVDYATIAEDSTEDVDYVGVTGTVTFAIGDASETITVQVNDDPAEEPDETFRVRLSNASPGLDFGSTYEATVTIEDNDSSEVFPFHVGFESGVLGSCWTTYTEVDGVIRIADNNGSAGYPDTPIGVRSVWLDADNGAGGGYGLEELILHIDLTGQQNVTFSFQSRGNNSFVLPDTFTGHSNGSGVAVSTDGSTWYKLQGLALNEGASDTEFKQFTIDLDAAMVARGLTYGADVQIKFNCYGNYYFDAIGFDDIQLYSPSFEFVQVDVPVLETDDALLTVLRKGDISGTASVAYQTGNGTALAGVDYTDSSGTLVFGDGVATNTIAVPIMRDFVAEPDGTFQVALSSPSSGYSIGVLNPATVTIMDDDTATLMPVNETFDAELEDYWTSYGEVDVSEGSLHLLGEGLRETILTVNAATQSNIYLRLDYRVNSFTGYLMPDTFSGHCNADGVAVSADGTNWIKVLGLTHPEGQPWLVYTNAEVFLDSTLAAHGLTYNDHLKIKFQNYSTRSAEDFEFDDIIVYSRQPLNITTTNLPHGTGMVSYATSLATSNGSSPYFWAVSNGLPNGLTLSDTGELSGTPTEEGSFPLDLFVEDSWGATGQTAVVLTIDPNFNRPPTVTHRDPVAGIWPMGEGTNALFTLEASDPEGTSLDYRWILDDALVSSTPTNYLHQTAWGDAGDHVLDVRVSDGLWSNVLASWTLQVSADNDGDGMSNAWERTYGLNPWDASDAGLDPDGDYLTNLEESQLGTSPTNSDSNGDSLSDGWQDLYGQDPLKIRDLAVISLERLGSVGGFSNAMAVAAYGDAVYLADGADGWKVFDASIPTNPVLVQSYLTASFAYDCTVEGDRLFMADGTNGLMKVPLVPDSFDISYSQKYSYPPASVMKSTVSGNRGYISLFGAVTDFHILDLTDGEPDPFYSGLDTTYSARDVAVQGTLAYVAGGNGEFTIIDVSDPETPFVRGALDTAVGTQGFEIAVTGTVAYLGANSGDIYVADVSNPDAPIWTHTNTFTSASVQEIITQDGFVFLAQEGAGIYSGGGLYVFDGSNSDWSVSITNILTLDFVKDICLTSNRLYVVDDEQGLIVFDYASDYDQDGLLDSWERARFGSLTQDADDDPDEDGITNLGEQRAGTNPLGSDSDSDGMNDGWEVLHMMNPANPSDASGNLDSDPQNNREEFIADTDPNDSNDWFCITGTDHLPMWTVYFDSSSNRWYTLLGCTNLVSNDWKPVQASRMGIGGADILQSTNNFPVEFYKLTVELP